jgi:hypothetical protein
MRAQACSCVGAGLAPRDLVADLRCSATRVGGMGRAIEYRLRRSALKVGWWVADDVDKTTREQ